MNSTNSDVGGHETPKRPVSLLKTLLILVIGMSVFAYGMLSTSKTVFVVFTIGISIFEVSRLVQGLKESKTLETLCEAAYFVVIITFLLGAYRGLLAFNPTLMFTTALYRPNFTLYRNRRLALALGLAIMVVTLPINLGIVTDPDAVQALTVLYALMVASLWVFCSRLGAKLFGFEESS
jgi:hypothetical protein